MHFVETTTFTDAWAQLGLNDEEDLTALQLLIMCSPEAHPVIPGTNGLRKLRFAPPMPHTGKRGGYRVCYVFFEEHWIVLLVHIYDKHEKDDLTALEKRAIGKYIDRAKQAIGRRKTI